MGTSEKVESAACRECQIDQCPLHCKHLGAIVPETETQKEAIATPKSLDYLKVKGGFSG